MLENSRLDILKCKDVLIKAKASGVLTILSDFIPRKEAEICISKLRFLYGLDYRDGFDTSTIMTSIECLRSTGSCNFRKMYSQMTNTPDMSHKYKIIIC